MSLNPDSEILMARYLDGRLTADEASELAELLTADPQAAERFAELTRVDEALRVELKAERRSGLFATRMGRGIKPAKPARQPADRRRWLAAAAGFTVLGAGAVWLARSPSPEAVGRAMVQSKLNNRTNGGNGFDSDSITTAGGRTADAAADLRRKLRGFALPPLQVRGTAVSDALAMLRQQWTDLPHRHADAGKAVKIDFSPGVRQLWPTREEEPLVTLDVPGISLQTALNLLATQAGLRVEVAENTVRLERDPQVAESAGQAEKTWTFPLPKATSDVFLASLAPQPVNVPVNFLKTGEISYDWLLQPGQNSNTALYFTPSYKNNSEPTPVKLTYTVPDQGVAPVGQEAEIMVLKEFAPADPGGSAGEIASAEATTDVDTLPRNIPAAPVEIATHFVSDYSQEKEVLSGEILSAGDPSPSVGFALNPIQRPWYFIPSTITDTTATLPTWLAGAGVPAEGVSEDAETGILSVTGSPQALRAAAAAVAALTESAQDGYSVEMRLIPAENPQADGLFKDGKPTEILTTAQVGKLSASTPAVPNPQVVRIPRGTSCRGGSVNLVITEKTASLTTSRPFSVSGRSAAYMSWDLPGEARAHLNAVLAATKSGELWTMKGKVSGPDKNSHEIQFTAADGEWTAVRLESGGGALLISLSPGTVTSP